MIKRKIFKSYTCIFSSLTKTDSTWHTVILSTCKSFVMSKLGAKHQEVNVPEPAEILGGVSRPAKFNVTFFFNLLLNCWIKGVTKCARYYEGSTLWSFWHLERWNEGNRTKQWIQLKSHFSSTNIYQNYFQSAYYVSVQLSKLVFHLM